MIYPDARGWEELSASAAVVGLAAARYMQKPSAESVWYAWAFDTIQSLAHNPDRIGQRRSIPNAQVTA